MTFKQVEALIEEIKIITPTIESLLSVAKDVNGINVLAGQNIKTLQTTIKEFEKVLMTAVAKGIDSKIEKLKEFDEFERRIVKNVQIIKNAADKIKPIQTINSLLTFGVGFLVGAIALFLILKGV